MFALYRSFSGRIIVEDINRFVTRLFTSVVHPTAIFTKFMLLAVAAYIGCDGSCVSQWHNNYVC